MGDSRIWVSSTAPPCRVIWLRPFASLPIRFLSSWARQILEPIRALIHFLRGRSGGHGAVVGIFWQLVSGGGKRCERFNLKKVLLHNGKESCSSRESTWTLRQTSLFLGNLSDTCQCEFNVLITDKELWLKLQQLSFENLNLKICLPIHFGHALHLSCSSHRLFSVRQPNPSWMWLVKLEIETRGFQPQQLVPRLKILEYSHTRVSVYRDF